MDYSLLGSPNFKLSKTTASLADEANGAITVFGETKNSYTADAERFRAIPSDRMPDDFQQMAESLRTRKIDLLRSELSVLSLLVNYYASLEKDRRLAQTVAEDAATKVANDLRAGLAALGYDIDGILPGSNTPVLSPIFFQRHPAVNAARAAVDELRFRSWNDLIQHYEDRAETIRAEIEEIRTKALAPIR